MYLHCIFIIEEYYNSFLIRTHNMRLFGTSRVTQETMIIGLGFQNIQFTLVILGMVIFRNPPLSIQIKVHLFYNISRSLS